MRALYNVLILLKFIAFMAIVYLLLHMLVARLVTDPGSKVLGFFALLTSPLTGPVRRHVPAGTPEGRVRLLALAALAATWLALTLLAAPLRPSG